jgi:predicted Na+-dependent transporter
MSATNSVVATAAIVAAGKWANDESISIRLVVGGVFLALGLTMMENANPLLGKRFATLLLVTAAFLYVPLIAYKAGLTTIKPPTWGGLITTTDGRDHGRSGGRKK